MSISPRLLILATSSVLGIIIAATADLVTAATVNMDLSFFDPSGKQVGTGSFSYDDSSPINIIDGGNGNDIQVGTIKKWFYVKSFQATINNMLWGLTNLSIWDSTNKQPQSVFYTTYGEAYLNDQWIFGDQEFLNPPALSMDDDSFTQVLASSGEYVSGFWAATEFGSISSSDAVPEAPTVLGSLTAIGMLTLFKRVISKKTEN